MPRLVLLACGIGQDRAAVVQKAEALDRLFPRVGAEVLHFVVPGFHQQQIAVLQQGLQFGDVLYIARETLRLPAISMPKE